MGGTSQRILFPSPCLGPWHPRVLCSDLAWMEPGPRNASRVKAGEVPGTARTDAVCLLSSVVGGGAFAGERIVPADMVN